MRKHINTVLFVGFCLFALVFAVGRMHTMQKTIQPYLDQKISYISVTAVDVAELTNTGEQKIAVRLGQIPGVLYLDPADGFDATPGDVISGGFKVKRTERANPFFSLTPKDAISIAEGKSALTWVRAFSRAAKAKISTLWRAEQQAAIIQGLLTGDKAKLSALPVLGEELFSSGFQHAVAVSGLHINLLMGFLVFFFGNRHRAVWLTLPIVFLFIAVTGFAPSAIRAGAMLTASLIAPLFGRTYNAKRSLVLVFCALVCYNPYLLFEAGMQLSFLSTLGLLVFGETKKLGKLEKSEKSEEIRKTSRLLSRFPGKLKSFVRCGAKTTFSALVFSLPALFAHFGSASLLAVPVNLVGLPLVTLIFALGGAAVLISFLIPPLAAVLAWLAAIPTQLLLDVFGLARKIPYAVAYTSQPYWGFFFGFFYLLVLVFVLTRRARPVLIAGALAFVCTIGFTVLDTKGNEIHFVDVGQGQCVVLSSRGKTVVFDVGGKEAQTGRIAAREIGSLGGHKVDLLGLTHYDTDHDAGTNMLCTLLPVERLIAPDWGEKTPVGISNRHGVVEPWVKPPTIVTEKEVVQIGDFTVTILPTDWIGEGNERELCYLIESGGFACLITGDVGQSVERWLLRVYDLPKVTMLVTGHHGSSNSGATELYDALKPDHAVISVGEGNRYGHPAQSVIESLADRNISCLRTDERGTIQVRVGKPR